MQSLWDSASKVLQDVGNYVTGTPPKIMDQTDGDEETYYGRFMEEKAPLGEGEFGVVTLLHQKCDGSLFACKLLKKGVVFKDNTLFAPLKPETLRGEVQMLRTLAGQHYCLRLEALYESPTNIHIVTEYCGGGEMLDYLQHRAKKEGKPLALADVSRITYQLFAAVAHCSAHGIIHRDIKPGNCMFRDKSPQADLCLIDFGSGVMDRYPPNNGPRSHEDLIVHTTYAGSAFYISPEMFQRTYTEKTDVWSAGATAYVLVAGFPSKTMQHAFDILQKAQHRNLKQLPGFPDDLPQSFFDFLDASLTYRHRSRPRAPDLLSHEFLQIRFSAGDKDPDHERQDGEFPKYEQVVTSLLSTTLSPDEVDHLVQIVLDRNKAVVVSEGAEKSPPTAGISVPELKALIRDDVGNLTAFEAIEKLVDDERFGDFVYRIGLLREKEHTAQ